MEVNLLGKIQVRRGTTAERLAVVLDSGEPAWDLDQKRFYTGDGVTPGGIPSDHTPADLKLDHGLSFKSGDGKGVLIGSDVMIGMEYVPPTRIVANKNINSAGVEMSLTMNNIKLVYTFYDINNSKAWVQTVQGSEYFDMRRCTVYNAAFDVNSYDNYLLTTKPLNFDVITYDDSNETTDIVIRENGRVWNVRVFLSGNGSRSTMWADLVYNPAETYPDSWSQDRTAPTVSLTPTVSPTTNMNVSPTPTPTLTPSPSPSGGVQVSPTPSPTPNNPNPSVTPSPTPTMSTTPTGTPNNPVASPTPSPSPNAPEVSVTPSPTPNSPAVSPTPTATITPSPSGTPASSPVAVTPTPSPSPNAPEPEPSATPTPTPTASGTPEATKGPVTPTPTITPSPSGTPEATSVPVSPTPTGTPEASHAPASPTPSITPSPSGTPATTPPVTPSNTPSPSAPPVSPSPTPTVTPSPSLPALPVLLESDVTFTQISPTYIVVSINSVGGSLLKIPTKVEFATNDIRLTTADITALPHNVIDSNVTVGKGNQFGFTYRLWFGTRVTDYINVFYTIK